MSAFLQEGLPRSMEVKYQLLCSESFGLSSSAFSGIPVAFLSDGKVARSDDRQCTCENCRYCNYCDFKADRMHPVSFNPDLSVTYNDNWP